MASVTSSGWNIVYNQCNSGTNKEKHKNLGPFPDYLDVELTNYCNLQCKMCPTGRNISSRKKGFINSALVRKIISECQQHPNCKGIRFVRWGEPLLHPHCVGFIRLVKDAGLLCHLNTNGSLADDEFLSDIIKCKLDSIKFSFQGITAYDYNTTRVGGDFDKLSETIRRLHIRRNKRKYPHIQVGTTITSATDSEIEGFRCTFKKFADKVDIGKTKSLFDVGAITTNYPNCPEVFNKLSVNWDGKVTACCSDWDGLLVVGDLNKQSLREIWSSKSLQQIREMLVKKQHNLLPVCRNCIIEEQKNRPTSPLGNM